MLMVAAGLAMLRNARRQPATRTAAVPSLVAATGSAGASGPDADPGAALIDIPAADLPVPPSEPSQDAPGRRATVTMGSLASPAQPPVLTYSVPLVLLLATATGLVTGFLGVGGGFLVVPALVLSLRMPVANATATGLVVIAIASTSALVVRLTHSATLSQPALTAEIVVATVIASLFAARFSNRMSPRALGTGFAVLVLGMSLLVAGQALQAFHAA